MKNVLAVSMRSPKTKGKAKKYRYVSSGVYEARERVKRPGTYYWHGPIATGPDRRSERLAERDAEALADRYRALDLSWMRGSIRGTDATEAVYMASYDPARGMRALIEGGDE